MIEPVAGRSALEQVESCLERIDAFGDRLHVTITVMADEARRAAARCDEATAGGRSLGLLHGMPVAIKDNIDTAGIRTTSGSKFFAERVPDTDAVVVAKLKAAGAIPIAKVNMAEFALGATSQNPHFGSCRTPWDPQRVPGGSSGGSGAAVAAEMAVAALGTDTGASVRLPGALNGVVGLRPTFGRVSNRGTTPVSPTLDTVGPLAHRVEDVARVLTVLQGYDPEDPASIAHPTDDLLTALHRGVDGLRVGIPRDFFFDDLDPGVASSVRAAIDRLAALGADMVEIRLSGAELAQRVTQRIMFPDLTAFHARRLAESPQDFGPDIRLGMQRFGLGTTGVEYAEAAAWRGRWQRQVETTLEQVDLIATPTAPCIAPRVDDLAEHALASTLVRFTNCWSLARVPAVSVPCGFVDGLPVGMQLIGRQWAEAVVLRAAAAYQADTDWHLRRPSLLDASR